MESKAEAKDFFEFMERMQEKSIDEFKNFSSFYVGDTGDWAEAGEKFSLVSMDLFKRLLPSLATGDPSFKLDAFMGLDAKIKAVLDDASNLASLSAELQALVFNCWLELYEAEFLEKMKETPSEIKKIDHWFDQANEKIITFQNSEEYMDIKRQLVNSLSDFQHSYRNLIETFLENNHMPTQTEVDDMSKSIHELKKEIRGLKKQINDFKKSGNTNEK